MEQYCSFIAVLVFLKRRAHSWKVFLEVRHDVDCAVDSGVPFFMIDNESTNNREFKAVYGRYSWVLGDSGQKHKHEEPAGKDSQSAVPQGMH